jgi:hypothetical protein
MLRLTISLTSIAYQTKYFVMTADAYRYPKLFSLQGYN